MSKEGIVNTRLEVPVPIHYEVKALVDKANINNVMEGQEKITINDEYVELINMGIEAKKKDADG